jgi:tetratricopeptide (TPR) repeat protein
LVSIGRKHGSSKCRIDGLDNGQVTDDPIVPTLLLTKAFSQMQAGQLDAALSTLLASKQHVRKSDIACNVLAYMYLSADKYKHAIDWFDCALRLRAHYPEALAGKGLALQSVGRHQDAIRSYDGALLLAPDDSETQYNRGVALEEIGEYGSSLAAFDATLKKRPSYLLALKKRCSVLVRLGRLNEAVSAFNPIFKLDPNCPDSWCSLGNVLQKLGRVVDALDCYERALIARPHFFAALSNRAATLKELQRLTEALECVGEALELDPQHADTLILKGNILTDLVREQEADLTYRRAIAIRPLRTYSAIKPTPDFKALFLFSPTSGNTPYEDLISNSKYESHVLLLLSDIDYDIARLHKKADVIVNLISDPDRGPESLNLADAFVRRFNRPIVNNPKLVTKTDRETVARLLDGIPGGRIPPSHRFTRDALLGMASQGSSTFPLPFIVRKAGTHGGDCMELLQSGTQLAKFVESNNGSDFYISEYADYQSSDGYFRKYRFIFVGPDILPYHLAIGDIWKVHHAATSMKDHPWMQEEERRFLDNPHGIFGYDAFEVLRNIRTRIGLDYFGIDCALDRSGRVVIFEVNSSMLVHLHNELFPYKDEYVLAIKSSFEAMLREKIRAYAIN